VHNTHRDTHNTRLIHLALDQLRIKKWNRNILSGSDDSIVGQELQWTPQGYRSRWRPKNSWERTEERNVDNWRNMERTELDEDKWCVAYTPLVVVVVC